MKIRAKYQQRKICKKYGVEFFASPNNMRLGISLNVKYGIFPINGLRHPPEKETTGWYVWAGGGEQLEEIDLFIPLCVAHLDEWCPDIIPYLGLPPGWRFLIAPDYEDVWFDERLLEI
jgi:hypothetical protein